MSMTSNGKNIYQISLTDSQSRMQSYCIVATSLTLATAEARALAGVGEDAETATTQKMGRVDSEAE